MSDSKQLSVLRLFAVLIYGYSIYYQQVNYSPSSETAFGKFKFLTYWDLLLQFTFFTIVLFGDSLLKKKSNSFTRFIDFFFFSLAYPVALLVSIVFWGLYAIDRELIFPKKIEEFYPIWLNHSTHTFVTLFVLCELVFGKHRLPSKGKALLALITFSASYSIWVLYIALVHDIWVYPFLNVLNWPERIVFFGFSLLFQSLLFYSGVFLNSLKTTTKTKLNKRK